MTPFSGDEFYEPMVAPARPRPEPAVPRRSSVPRRSFAPRRPWAARTWYRPVPGLPCDCGCLRRG